MESNISRLTSKPRVLLFLGLLGLMACGDDIVRVAGTVRYDPIELGFWEIRGDDGITYDPMNLPTEFKQEGLRVFLVADKSVSQFSFHMVGPVVKIVTIQRQ